MAKPRFKIKLAGMHEKVGITAYRVAADLGLNFNTVRKYLVETVETERLESHVIQIVEYFGLDWTDPDVIEVLEDEKEDTKPVRAINDDGEAGAA